MLFAGDKLVEQALFRLARDQRYAARTSLQEGLTRAQIEPGRSVFAMAALAARLQQRDSLLCNPRFIMLRQSDRTFELRQGNQAEDAQHDNNLEPTT
ncbi:MAG: hypothetical protein ABI882_21220 [Acidobacteriota bacterium]